MRYAFAIAAMLATGPTWAETYDQQAKRLCSSLEQEDCRVKVGVALCDRDQMACRRLEDGPAVKILSKVGNRYHVETPIGRGYVSDRSIILSGDK